MGIFPRRGRDEQLDHLHGLPVYEFQAYLATDVSVAICAAGRDMVSGDGKFRGTAVGLALTVFFIQKANLLQGLICLNTINKRLTQDTLLYFISTSYEIK